MVNLGANLIAVIGAVTVRAVRQATSTIPIVFAVVVEPIATDWPRTWNAGGNVTGVTTFDPQQATAQFEFLRAVSSVPAEMLAKANEVISVMANSKAAMA